MREKDFKPSSVRRLLFEVRATSSPPPRLVKWGKREGEDRLTSFAPLYEKWIESPQ